LGKPVSPINDFSADEMEAADFLIDVSVLRRSGYENTRMGIETNKFIRSLFRIMREKKYGDSNSVT
jgi:hypothetical protein